MTPDFVIVDLETTGLDLTRHEIIEIGAVRVSADLSAERGTFSQKTLPNHPDTADPEALAVNGYTKAAWAEAVMLDHAISEFLVFADGGMLAGFNVAFDWAFLHTALNQLGIPLPREYHIFDVFSLAYHRALQQGPVDRWSLAALCKHFGVPVPAKPHRALADARATLALLRAVTIKSFQ